MFSVGPSGTGGLPPPPPSGGIFKSRAPHLSQQTQQFEPLNIPDSPPKLARRPPKKGNKRETLSDIARRVPVEVIRPYFNYPLRKAAEALCISVTTLKRLCRRHGVKRWPHRQLSGLNRAVSHLEAKRLALKDGPNDPIIADQLRQLYCRRDVIIDLAFMSDDEATAARGKLHGVKPEYSGLSQQVAPVQHHEYSSGHTAGHQFPQGIVGSSASSMVPWWHRDPGALATSGGGHGGDGYGGNGGGAPPRMNASHHSGGPDGRGRMGTRKGDESEKYVFMSQHGGMSVNASVSSGGGGGSSGGNGGGGSGAMPSYRASSVLVRRLPGLPGMPPPSSGSSSVSVKMEAVQPSSSSFKLPSPESLLAGIPSASSAGGPAASTAHSASGQMSPMTIGATKPRVPRIGTSCGGGGVVKPPPPHFIPLPAHHPSDNMDKQIAELANLNDILFGPDQQNAEMMDPNSLALMMNAPSGSGGGSGAHQRGGGGSGGGGGGGGGEGGRLPSIAGLVAAGALLSSGKHKQWNRGCRQNGGVLVRGRTGEV